MIAKCAVLLSKENSGGGGGNMFLTLLLGKCGGVGQWVSHLVGSFVLRQMSPKNEIEMASGTAVAKRRLLMMEWRS